MEDRYPSKSYLHLCLPTSIAGGYFWGYFSMPEIILRVIFGLIFRCQGLFGGLLFDARGYFGGYFSLPGVILGVIFCCDDFQPLHSCQHLFSATRGHRLLRLPDDKEKEHK